MNHNHSIHSNFRVTKPFDSHSVSTSSSSVSIKFDSGNETLILKGTLSQKDLHDFYFPIKSQLSLHLAKGKGLIVGIFFSDLSLTNVKMLFEMFSYLRRNVSERSKVKVKWFVSPFDTSILEVAKDFESLFKIGIETVLTRAQY